MAATAACGDDAESGARLGATTTSTTPTTEPPTTAAPTTTAASTSATTRQTTTTARPVANTQSCPLSAIGGGATDVTTKPGDFDGNGVVDTLRAYKLGSDWHLRVELSGAASGHDVVVPGVDPGTGLKAVGGFNLDENQSNEAFVVIGSGASTTLVAIFVFKNCQLTRVTEMGNAATFQVGASAQNRSGLSCVQGTALQTLSASAPPNTGTPFSGRRTTYDLVGSDLVQANVSPQETFGLNDPGLAPFSRFTCGSLSLN